MKRHLAIAATAIALLSGSAQAGDRMMILATLWAHSDKCNQAMTPEIRALMDRNADRSEADIADLELRHKAVAREISRAGLGPWCEWTTTTIQQWVRTVH